MVERDDSLDLSALKLDEDQRRVRRRRPRWRTPAILLGAVVVLAAAARFLPLPFLLPRVETVPVQVVTPVQAHTVLTATGYTYARERAAVGAKIVGRVTRLGADEGDRVEKGQMIAELESTDLRAAVHEAEARLAQAQADLAEARREEARQKALLEQSLTPQSVYDAASTQLAVSEAQVGTAEAALRSARAQAAYATITAPISGIVIERNIEVGEMVAPGGFTSQQSTGAIMRIADLNSLEVEADINESYIAKVRIDQPAVIKVDAVPDHPYRGCLRQVVPTADRQRGTVQVKVTIDDRDRRLVPDMSCSVSFLEPGTTEAMLAEPSRILVPAKAVVAVGGRSEVYLVEDGRIHAVPVVAGSPEGDLVAVTSGLDGGERVVAAPGKGLEEGKRVRESGR